MCKKLFFLIPFVLVLGLAGVTNADPITQDPGPDGIVSVEAEHFDDNVEQSGAKWEEVGPTGGFTGTAGMQVLGPSFYDPGYAATSPRLEYEINFVKTGTHYVWILAWAAGGGDDSCHVGLDGEERPLSSNWSGGGNTWSNGRYPETGRAQFEVTTTGIHVLNIWVREDGLIIDKIVLTTNPDYTPTGEGPMESSRGPRLQAYAPLPEDGAILLETWVNLTWSAGDTAVSHDVYLGENFEDVNNGVADTFQINQTTDFFVAGFPGMAFPEGLVPGTTYYWRIDEIEADGTKHKGNVWSFSIPPVSAYDPTPLEGAMFVPTDATLSWTGGLSAKLHTVFFGDNFDDVNSAPAGAPSGSTAFDPGPLELEKTYYWRVDEFDGFGTHRGDVWSFTTTLPGLGKAIAQRWENIPTTDINTLKDNPNFPNNPTVTEEVTKFSWDGPDTDDYGGRIEGWLYVPFTGDYTFWLNTDDQGELWLSTDDDSSNVVLIAQESSYSSLNAWASGEEQSDPIPLVAGEKYYIMALWKEGGGGDHCQVAWQGPGIPDRTIIAGTYLAPFEPLSAYGAKPVNRATGVTQSPILEWKPGIEAASHEVYFGTDEQAVANATKASAEYKGSKTLGDESLDPGKLPWESTFYWRVDEINPANPESPWVGSVWSFTTADFLIVEDLEGYTDNDAANEAIWQSWIDGFGVATNGSQVGYVLPPYAEPTIVHGGRQSMPLSYDNRAGVTNSQAELTLTAPRDWTEGSVGELSIWFQGRAGSAGSFIEGPAGTYTITSRSGDIWNQADEFHYAYKTLTGAGTIVARIDSVVNTAAWTKCGVMIRETLDPGSKFAAVYVMAANADGTPTQGARFQARTDTDGSATSDTSVATAEQMAITAPYWVKLERDVAGNFRGSYSSNGSTWQSMVWRPSVSMGSTVYVGLALTSNNTNAVAQAKISNVTITGTAGAQWANQDIGIAANAAEPLYVAVSNATGAPAVVAHDDPAAANVQTWTEWVIPLQAFADQGINLANVDKIAIGLGSTGGAASGGSGVMYFDDIRLYRPRAGQ